MNLSRKEVIEATRAAQEIGDPNYPWDSWTKHGWKDIQWSEMGKLYEKTVPVELGVSPSERKFLEGWGLYIDAKLGSGGYGVVYNARREFFDTTTNETVTQLLACKITSMINLKKRNMTVKMVVTKMLYESDIHALFNHENIVQMEDLVHLEDPDIAYTHPIRICHFMELCKGTLADVMEEKGGKLSEKRAARWLHHIGKALHYIHTNFCSAHYDLKPQNILYILGEQTGIEKKPIDNYIYKLADFGMSKAYNDYDSMYETNIYGNKRIELYRQESGSHFDAVKDDVCNLGLVLAESLIGLASPGEGVINLREFILNKTDATGIQYRDRVEYQIKDAAIELIDWMTDSDQNQRPVMSEVLQHQFITKYYPYEYEQEYEQQEYGQQEYEQQEYEGTGVAEQFGQLGIGYTQEDPNIQYEQYYPEQEQYYYGGTGYDEPDYDETNPYLLHPVEPTDTPQMGLLGPTQGSQWAAKDVANIPTFTPKTGLNPKTSEFFPRK